MCLDLSTEVLSNYLILFVVNVTIYISGQLLSFRVCSLEWRNSMIRNQKKSSFEIRCHLSSDNLSYWVRPLQIV
jgi:hypothetical protein